MTRQFKFEFRGALDNGVGVGVDRGSKDNMACVVSQPTATAEHGPFADICLEPLIKNLSQLTHLSQSIHMHESSRGQEPSTNTRRHAWTLGFSYSIL